ncbi:MAG TPA: biotin carboxylase N-terminal domain-containing protein, partial [Dehalococcoidia bacterium]|nr:biotin carboxylase N-terminal domain-containing protein [Dehalococcoidia bacterium]
MARAAASLGVQTVAVYSEDDDRSLHVLRANEARALSGRGPAAYMDVDQLLQVARTAGCEAVHPGYGFLSESATFARRCAEAGLTFVGPQPEVLERLGDKASARGLAGSLGLPVLPGSAGSSTLDEVRDFHKSLGPDAAIAIKAVFGGGGRGMRIVRNPDELENAYERCRSESLAAFGRDEVYVEQFLPHARHIEVQVVGDGEHVIHLGERDCTIQRRHQKILEIAPSPFISPALRDQLTTAALRIASELHYANLGTFEFLVDAEGGTDSPPFYFIEANPRLQVEHTVTEQVAGVDLVATQLQLAAGRSLEEIGLIEGQVVAPRGFAIQARVNLEELTADGSVRFSGGQLTVFEPPSGPGVRVDTGGYLGYSTNPSFDSLLAKVIASSPSPDFSAAVKRLDLALGEFRFEGATSNIALLLSILRHPDFLSGRIDTGFLESHLSELVKAAAEFTGRWPNAGAAETSNRSGLAGARVDSLDPLAVLEHGKSSSADIGEPAFELYAPEGTVTVRAPMQGTIISIDIAEGEEVLAGQGLLVMEAMKMEHVISAQSAGRVREIAVHVGDTVFEGYPLLLIEEADVEKVSGETAEDLVDLDHVRPDLAEVHARHEMGLDEKRPDAVERRRKTGQRTARENILDLCDDGSFVEYGPLVIAAQ